ncbi:MAG: AAA family ATPase, partial [Caulobacteraceae bacterium]|nr:AAA family ATPase [Caulobacteraceae bacterium]
DVDAVHLNTLTPQDAMTPAFQTDSSAVDTETKILLSRSLAGRVVDQLHLDQDPEFNAALRNPGFLARMKQRLGLGPAQSEDPALTQQRQREDVISTVLSDLSVKRAETTYAIDVAFTAFEPQKAAVIVNAFVQQYLAQQLEAKFDEATRGTAFLKSQLETLHNAAEQATAAVQSYKIDNNLLSAQGATLTEQQISNLDLQVAQARADDAQQDARLSTAEHQLAAGSNGGDIDAALGSPVIGALRSQHAQASAQLADLEARYGDKYPEVIKQKKALADIDAQIHAEIERVISNLKAQSQISHSKTAAIAAAADQTRGSLVANNKALVRLSALQSDADSAQTLYAAFLDRYKEAIAKAGTQRPDAHIASAGELPTEPSKPNKKLAAILAGVLGLVAGLAAVTAAELLRRGVSSAAEAEAAYDLPCLAELPLLASTFDDKAARRRKLDPVDYVAKNPLSRFAEAFRNLRASIALSSPASPPRLIAITSALPGEGKTTTTLCLARTIALSGASVVVVDGDLRQRAVTRRLPKAPAQGLLEVLSGEAPLAKVLTPDAATSAMVLPLAESAFTPKDVFGRPEMDRLLDQLKEAFDFVIVDTAPVLAVADTKVLAPKMDAVVFVTRWRKTTKDAAQEALRNLDGGVNLAGLALSQVDVREQARTGEGAARYYREYSKYYAQSKA